MNLFAYSCITTGCFTLSSLDCFSMSESKLASGLVQVFKTTDEVTRNSSAGSFTLTEFQINNCKP